MNTPQPANAEGVGISGLFGTLSGLTGYKAKGIYDRGEHELTGVVMRHKTTGEMCIVELSAVRWVSKDDSWTLMHPSPDVQAAGMKLGYVPNDQAHSRRPAND